MATIKSIALLFCLLWAWSGYAGEPVLEDQTRSRVVAVAESYVGVREKTGNNDGTEVEMFLRTAGLSGRYAWCAAFASHVFVEAGVKAPVSAWSPDWFRNNVVYWKNRITIEDFRSQPGQVFGLYYERLGRIGHVGLIVGEDRLHYRTIEGNTGPDGGRDGDGVYKKIRRKQGIYKIADYVE